MAYERSLGWKLTVEGGLWIVPAAHRPEACCRCDSPFDRFEREARSGPGIDVVVAGEILGTARGKAKKEAEQEAARLAQREDRDPRRLDVVAVAGESDAQRPDRP